MSEELQEPKLELEDMLGLIQAINTASERGAFRGNELSTVGKYYDRVTAFLEYAQKKQASEQNVPSSEQPEGQGNDS